MIATRPPRGSVERWAWRFVRSQKLEDKQRAPARALLWDDSANAVRLPAPGRPPCLQLRARGGKSLRRGAYRNPERRAEILHAFWHHELQAAELMAWAILAFPGTPRAFRQGLLNICRDEIKHMKLYARQIERLGSRLGAFPVRDWFWQRAQQCSTPLQFVSFLGIGLGGGNLDHGERFVEIFREAGDDEAAKTQAIVVREEVAHVSFAMHWFEEWSGARDFESWKAQLIPPLSPLLFKGAELNVAARRAAGMPDAFLEAFEAFVPDDTRAEAAEEAR